MDEGEYSKLAVDFIFTGDLVLDEPDPDHWLAGIASATVVISWMASRIFRVAILLQGKAPNLPELLRWGIRG